MQNLKQLLEAGEITQAAYDILTSTIVSCDGELTPLNTVIVQWYTKEHYEENTGNTVSDADWSELSTDWDMSEYIFGDCETHMNAITDEL
jgi:hypothetical protein